MKRAPWHTCPFVSALLVTTDPSRRPLLERLVANFPFQTWPVKELVLVNATTLPIGSPMAVIREVMVKARLSLGELKNLAIDNAHGEWCVFMSDDSWFGADYLETHMRAASDPEQVGVMREFPARFVDTGSVRFACGWDLAYLSFFRLIPWRFDSEGTVPHFVTLFSDYRLVNCDYGTMLRFLHER